MNAHFIKERFRQYAEIHKKPISEVAASVGVSPRTVQRWLDPNSPTMPSLQQLATMFEQYDLSLDMLLYPGRFPAPATAAHRATARSPLPMGAMIFNHLPALWMTRDGDVRYCTNAFATLYDVLPVDLIGKNLFRDWGWYGESEEHYGWMKNRPNQARESMVGNVMTEAEEFGSASQVCWFLAPNGHLRRVLMYCWYQADDDSFLVIDVPMARADWDVYQKVTAANGTRLDYSLTNQNGRQISVPQASNDTIKLFMMGWDIGHIAQELDLPRSQIARFLNEWRYAFCADDFEHLREILMEHVADEMLCDHWFVLRCNAHNLK